MKVGVDRRDARKLSRNPGLKCGCLCLFYFINYLNSDYTQYNVWVYSMYCKLGKRLKKWVYKCLILPKKHLVQKWSGSKTVTE